MKNKFVIKLRVILDSIKQFKSQYRTEITKQLSASFKACYTFCAENLRQMAVGCSKRESHLLAAITKLSKHLDDTKLAVTSQKDLSNMKIEYDCLRKEHDSLVKLHSALKESTSVQISELEDALAASFDAMNQFKESSDKQIDQYAMLVNDARKKSKHEIEAVVREMIERMEYEMAVAQDGFKQILKQVLGCSSTGNVLEELPPAMYLTPASSDRQSPAFGGSRATSGQTSLSKPGRISDLHFSSIHPHP